MSAWGLDPDLYHGQILTGYLPWLGFGFGTVRLRRLRWFWSRLYFRDQRLYFLDRRPFGQLLAT